MRFDNPITDHGFELPDLAQYSDVKNEWRMEEDDWDYAALYKAVEEGSKEALEKEIQNIFMASLSKINELDFENEEDLKKFELIDVTQQEVELGRVWYDKLMHFFDFYQSFERKSITNIDTQVFSDLYNQGVHVGNVDTTRLSLKLKDNIKSLLSKPDWRPDPGTFDRAEQLGPNILGEVQQLFEQNGFIEAASAYNARQLKVANVVLHIAKPTDQNYKQFFYDCESVPKTTCMHIDPKEDVIKAMIYLNDVDLDSGPFSYIPGSNRWVHDPLQNLFGRAITTGSYCDTPIKRKSVFRLPPKLRVSHNFGRAVEDGTELSDALLDAEWKITSDMGNAILFDPGAGIHRGGICNTGTRIALQVLMK